MNSLRTTESYKTIMSRLVSLLTACLIVISFSAFSFEAFAAPLPDIEVLGKGTVIANGDSSPDISDDTDFESTFVSSSLVKTFTITNTGGQDLNLTGDPIVQVSGSSTFSVSSQPGSSVVLGSASVTFDVQFLPDSDGMHNATISIASNDGDENPYTFSIKGTGLGTPEMAVFGNGTEILNGDTTPDPADHTDFDSTGIGNPKEKTFTIENTGNADLDLTGTPLVQLSGSSGFSVSQQPLTDPVPAGTTTFIVRFVPDSVGEHTATVTIPNDDGDENPYTFSIKGTGFTAPPTLSNPTVASIDTTSAYLGADIASNGGDPIYDYGVYWNTVSPAESGTKCQKSMTDPGTGTYTVSCGSMLIGTKIYFKGYATNSVGTGYTPEDYFYTEPLQASNVQISAFTDESMTITWDNDPTSSGAIVVMSTSSSLSLPEDKPYDVGDSWTVYDVEIEEYLIVYSGSGSSVDVGGLDATTSYYIWVYAYSGSGEEINYQQDSPEQTAALRQWQLTTTVDPPGNGNLSPDCTAGCMYTENTQVVVTAYEFDFPFYRWIGCDQSSGLSCTMTMNWDRSLTAEYWSCAFPVLTAGTPTGFNTLQGGYNSAVAGDTIFAENTLFDGDFYVNASKTVFFEGGYDCVFDSVVGTTIVKGDMFVSGGKFTVDYGKLQVGLWVVVNDNCMECHGQVQGSYRQITGSGGDFVKNSHHVSDGTSNEIVTDEDCIVCHAEESNDGLHTNGYIDLKDADYYVPATGESGPLGIFTLGDGQGEPGTGSWSDDRDLTIFCLSCHDADGASVTFRTGGTALNPFNDGLTNSHEPFGMDGAPAPHSRPRVVDVNSLLDPFLTASHHNVLDYKYSFWEDGVDIEGIDDRAFTGTALINGNATEGALLECADCHTTAENAHGAVNSRYFLKDKYGNDALGADNTVICFRCHSESVYYQGTEATYSIFSGHQGQLANHNVDGDNIFGINCLNCHGGNNFGAIHGASVDEVIDDGGVDSYQPYRFMNGASMGYISNWNGTSVSCGAKVTTTFFSNCTNHNRGSQSYDREYLRELDY